MEKAPIRKRQERDTAHDTKALWLKDCVLLLLVVPVSSQQWRLKSSRPPLIAVFQPGKIPIMTSSALVTRLRRVAVMFTIASSVLRLVLKAWPCWWTNIDLVF